MSMIDVQNITKDYGQGRGVFNVEFAVERGEALGFLGPNGAGKTTTIRQLMGFIRPDRGSLLIQGMDCFRQADKIQKKLGYLPGEIAFIDNMTGDEFIRFVGKMKGMTDFSRAEELKEIFELTSHGKIKKMSKGMKQKIGIICAFMQNPDILILDEPTSGLDPLMQNRFLELVRSEKQRGATILMSSHIFEEVERTCDRAVIIRSGQVVATENVEKLRSGKQKTIEIRFDKEESAASFCAAMKSASQEGTKVSLQIAGSMDTLIKQAARYNVLDLDIRTPSLEELFMHFYGGSNHDK